jgi:hypothetical protein
MSGFLDNEIPVVITRPVDYFETALVVSGATGLVSFAFKMIKGPKLELAGLTLPVVPCLAYSSWASFAVGAHRKAIDWGERRAEPVPQTLMQWAITLFGAGGISKFLWDAIAARSQNRKNKTDNTVTLMNSATGYVEILTKRIDSISNGFDEFRREQGRKDDDRDRRERQQARLLLEHSRWDHRVTNVLRDLGRPIEEAPPLFIAEGNES